LFISLGEPALVENDISRFWKALVDTGVDKTGRLWTLADESVPWIGGVRTFYNRECYDDICNSMNSKRLVLVKGTPGIGKTMFLQRILVDIVAEAKETAKVKGKPLVLPTIDYLAEERKTYILHQNGTVTERKISQDADYVLSDSVDIGRVHSKILTLEVASDKDNNYRKFLKRIKEAGGDGDVLVMPLCTLEELRGMDQVISDDDSQLLYDIFGGSARNFKCNLTRNVAHIDFVEETMFGGSARNFKCNLTRNVAHIDFVEKTMLWYFGEDIKNRLKNTWELALSNMHEELGKSPDQSYFVWNSMMRHRSSDGETVWASKFMEILSSKIYEKRETSMFAELKKLVGSSGAGIFFENIAHVQLTTSTTSFDLIPLHRPHAKKVCRESVSFTCPERVMRLRSVEDIEHLVVGTYGLPITPNYPLVDAIVQPNVLLQMTISEEKHKGAVDELQAIRDGLLEKDPLKHKMVFVVPEKNMKTFKYQKDLKDIPQFVMCPHPVLDTTMEQKKRNVAIRDITAELAATTLVSGATSSNGKPYQCHKCKGRFKTAQGLGCHRDSARCEKVAKMRRKGPQKGPQKKIYAK
jgi:hypothetical protein